MTTANDTTTGTRHTPGPWTAEVPPRDAYTDPDIMLNDDTAFWIAGPGRTGEVLASVFRTSHGEADTNARLIAAAPQLLDALKALARIDNGSCWCDHAILPGHSSACLKARAAIAKAEGRTL